MMFLMQDYVQLLKITAFPLKQRPKLYKFMEWMSLQLKLCQTHIFRIGRNQQGGKNKEYNRNIFNSKKQIRKQMQQSYYYGNCLLSNNLFNAAMRHHFVWYKFYKDLNDQCECPLNNWLCKWRKMFNSPHFECNKYSMTPPGLINHLYASEFVENCCI